MAVEAYTGFALRHLRRVLRDTKLGQQTVEVSWSVLDQLCTDYERLDAENTKLTQRIEELESRLLHEES